MEYFKCSKKRKGELLNEAESILKWSRKHIIRQIAISIKITKLFKLNKKKKWQGIKHFRRHL